MNLARFPRRRYTIGSTPIEKLSRLSHALGGPDIYMKRYGSWHGWSAY